MDTYDPVALLFDGMEKLGPGDNAHTLLVLRCLPAQQFRVVVDAGCGTGRQTLALAKELGTPLHAVDSSERFLHDLVQRAREANVDHLVQVRCMDMKDIPQAFQGIDLLWSEGVHTVSHNVKEAERAGYQVLTTHTLPREAWVDGYYDILAPRASGLLGHSDPGVRDFAAETVREIEVFQRFGDSYGYVFFVLQRAEPGVH
jgi:SAM-dependent methyltransferase